MTESWAGPENEVRVTLNEATASCQYTDYCLLIAITLFHSIMVTMTTLICHTHLIAMLYYCGYLLQAGEIGRGH